MLTSKRLFLQQLASTAAFANISSMGTLSFASEQSVTPIRIGQIGMAHGHANKLQVYRNSSNYEVVGIVEENDDLYKRHANDPAFIHLPRLSRSELLDQPDLQAVLIESEISDLLRHAEACIDANLHIHLDKPAGESYQDFERIMQSAERKSLLVQLGYMFRYNPAVVLLKEFVNNGWLGEIFEVHAVMSKQVGREEREQLARYPGGMMFELGCHLIDIVTNILGEPEQITAHKSHATKWDDDLWDNMLAVFQYPHAIASIRSSCIEVDGGRRRQLTVCGTRGTFHIEPLDNPRVRLTLESAVGNYAKGTHWIDLPKYTRYIDDAQEMADVIRGKKSFSFSYEHDLITQRAVLLASGLSLK